MNIWKFEHLNIRTFEHLNIRTFEHLNIRTFEHLNIWTFEHLNIWTFEHLSIWTFEHLNIWTFEHLNIWTFEHLNIWTFEHLNIWTLEIWTFEHLNISQRNSSLSEHCLRTFSSTVKLHSVSGFVVTALWQGQHVFFFTGKWIQGEAQYYLFSRTKNCKKNFSVTVRNMKKRNSIIRNIRKNWLKDLDYFFIQRGGGEVEKYGGLLPEFCDSMFFRLYIIV